ncbi:hypothetical protein GGI07_002432 [Coemansia sp. Benny D115]|nr:hypothetical protein GGI07_002432 [Coemansia sp. Benny D115]
MTLLRQLVRSAANTSRLAFRARQFTTTQKIAAAQPPARGGDRTQSAAFTKKEVFTGVKRLRSGTTTSVNMVNANPLYYTAKAPQPLPVLGNDAVQASKFVQISGSFMEAVGKGHSPGTLDTDFGLFGQAALLHREFTEQLAQRLEEPKSSARAVVVDGEEGAGKSAELMKLAAMAHARGWITVYAPNTLNWVNSSRPYAPVSNTGNYVQLELALELLRSTLVLSREALAKVTLGSEVTLGKRVLAANSTLADLADFGVQTPVLAQEALDALLSVACAQTQVPVLLALDSVNVLWCQTAYRDQQDNVLGAERLRLVQAFRPYFENRAVALGCAVGATSYLEKRFMPRDLRLRLNPPRMVPLANPEVAKDSAVVRPQTETPFDVLRVGRLSGAEAQGLIQYYHDTRVVSMPVSQELVSRYWVVSGGNARKLFKSVTSYF